MYLAISETIRYKVTKLGDVIATSNSDYIGKQCSSCKTIINSLPISDDSTGQAAGRAPSQAIHYDRDIDGHVTHSHNN